MAVSGEKIVFIANAADVSNEEAQVHLVSFSSAVVRRIVNNNTRAETDVVESAGRVRAALADAHGAMDERQVKTAAAARTTSLWFTDGSSRYDTLQRPIPEM
eukprot:6302301-Heterocapsa_arctica.AAC.1